ncbi:MAG: phosphoethanolamine transferase [Alphaproteobacteria bacterium]|nr:phosphoethanolamine transferase [Alphaproteobacteria bacterium]
MRKFSKTRLLLIISIVLSTGWAAALAYFLSESVSRRNFSEFLLSFFAYSLLMGAMALLSLRRSHAALFFRYALLCFCILSATGISILFMYYKKIEARFSYSDVLAIAQSNLYESFHYFFAYIVTPLGIILALIFSLFACVVVKINAATIAHLNIDIKKYRIVAIGALAAGFSAFILLSQLYIVRGTHSMYRQYHENIREFHKYSDALAASPVDVALKKEKGELYVIVIGESESRDFMHCYGGPAENTPWADSLRTQPDWVIFENAYTFQTHTVPNLSAALGAGRALTGLTFPKGQNIVGISKQAGIHTAWLSNQSPAGRWDNPISALAYLSDNVQFTTLTHKFHAGALPLDSALLPFIAQALDQADPAGNNLLIIHLMGSHTPYHKRYSESFPAVHVDAKKFLGKVAEDKKTKKRYQEYLTSIKHTDDVLKSIHSLVAQHADRPAALLYFADHGEDIFSKGGGHNFSEFTWTMARIPMYLWFSQAYREKYPDRVSSARANREKIFTNDLIYDLYLGLSGIQSESYLAEYDISSKSYSLTWDRAVIAEGKQPKTDPAVIAAQNFKPRLAAHRVNSLFKLKQLQKVGLRNFEVDVRYEEREGRPTLQVGHDPQSIAGMAFSEYLAQLYQGFDFLWVDIKNLSEDNSASVLALLNSLDSNMHGLRSKMLLETSRPQAAKIIADDGWNTSYYLPWKKLAEALAAKDEGSLRSMAADISDLVLQNNIGAVSYDIRANEAVQKYLLPQLPARTKAYAWSTKLFFADPNLPDNIRPYEHLRFLLVRYDSPFDI